MAGFKKSLPGGSVIRYKWMGENRKTEIGKALAKRMDRAAEHVKIDIQNSFQSGPEPSSAGETPAIQKGKLLSSISWDRGLSGMGDTGKATRDKMGRYSFENTRRIFSDQRKLPGSAPYGIYLELGTSKISARPFLAPAAVRNESQVKSIMTKRMRGLGSK